MRALPMLGLVGAVLLLWKVARSGSGPLPIISMLMLVSNVVWWCFVPQQAFVWATIFHGIQYLAIVTIFHVQDQMARPDNRRSRLYHVAWLYGVCLVLGYGLFSCLPWGFVAAGFGVVESIVLVVAAINIHHFIVDAYIWRLKKGDGNRQIVESPCRLPLEPDCSIGVHACRWWDEQDECCARPPRHCWSALRLRESSSRCASSILCRQSTFWLREQSETPTA